MNEVLISYIYKVKSSTLKKKGMPFMNHICIDDLLTIMKELNLPNTRIKYRSVLHHLFWRIRIHIGVLRQQ